MHSICPENRIRDSEIRHLNFKVGTMKSGSDKIRVRKYLYEEPFVQIMYP